MNARAEAEARLGGRYDARVLEPSPPAVRDEPWLADDPAGRGVAGRAGLPRISPVAGAEVRWADLAARDPQLAQWCAERWLASYPTLAVPPPQLQSTRMGLHCLAQEILSTARRHANGKIGLRYTRGGFGTPFFADDVQLRVVGDQLVVQSATEERSAPITDLAAMARHVGLERLPAPVTDDSQLEVDRAATMFLADWFGFACSVLEELRAGVTDALQPSRVQLWPEHFDLAIELGCDSLKRRAGYGASPGDELHPEPYLYVVPWHEVPGGPLWQAEHYRGAELSYTDLLASADQRGAALAFYRERLSALET